MQYSQLSVKVLPRTLNSRKIPDTRRHPKLFVGLGEQLSMCEKSDKCKFVPRLLSMIADSSKFVLEGQRGLFLAIFPRHNDGT